MADPAPGRIIVVNGTSGSGKSSTCERFVARRDDFWLLYGIDHFLAGTFPAKFGHHGPRASAGVEAVPRDPGDPGGALMWRFGEHGRQGFAALHAWIAGAARAGCNIIFDHILTSDPPVIADLAWRLEGLPALLVTLKPPIDVLASRVAERTMTKRMPTDVLGEDAAARIVDRLNRLRPWFYDEVYANPVCDLEIDTAACGIEEAVDRIEARLAGEAGTAFAELRRRNPR